MIWIRKIAVLLLSACSGSAFAAERMPHCGVAAVYGVAKIHGVSTTPSAIEASILSRSPGANLSALSLKQLREAMGDLGLSARAFQVTQETLPELPTPCIVYIRPERLNRSAKDIGHVVILASITDKSVRILDLTLSTEPIDVSKSEFAESWDGEYLAVSGNSSYDWSVHPSVWLALAVVSLTVFVWSMRQRSRISSSV